MRMKYRRSSSLLAECWPIRPISNSIQIPTLPSNVPPSQTIPRAVMCGSTTQCRPILSSHLVKTAPLSCSNVAEENWPRQQQQNAPVVSSPTQLDKRSDATNSEKKIQKTLTQSTKEQ